MTQHEAFMLWIEEVALTAAAVTLATCFLVVRDWWRRR